jgi:hypothetical protein
LQFAEEWDKLQTKEEIMTIDELPWPWEVVMMEKGLAKGRKEGLKEGRTRGLREGQAKGLLEARRQALLEALETRFGEVGDGVRERVLGLSDEAQLRQAHRLAITVSSPEEFLAAF